MATLINGNGFRGVTAQKDADFCGGFAGGVSGRLQIGQMMTAAIVENTPRVYDGVIITKEGRRIQIDYGSYDDFTIPAGTEGVTKYYLIGYKLSTAGDGAQTCSTFVELSTSTGTIAENMLKDGHADVYVSLYRVTQSGTINSLGECLLPLFTPLDTSGSTETELANTTITWKGIDIRVTVFRGKTVFVSMSGTLNSDVNARLQWVTVGTFSGITPPQTVEGWALINNIYLARYRWTTGGLLQIGYSYILSSGSTGVIQTGFTLSLNFAFAL